MLLLQFSVLPLPTFLTLLTLDKTQASCGLMTEALVLLWGADSGLCIFLWAGRAGGRPVDGSHDGSSPSAFLFFERQNEAVFPLLGSWRGGLRPLDIIRKLGLPWGPRNWNFYGEDGGSR